MTVINYNIQSSKELGWKPSWFGGKEFNNDLTNKIKDFQKDHGLTADGMCGDLTFRRIYTQRIAENSLSEVIVCNGKLIPIEWNKVVLWDEPAGLKAPVKSYRTHKGKRPARLFVNHWDVCLSAKSCFNVLKKRKLSVHFLIDNDGTIYQTMDCNHIAYHAGNFNRQSIGVEISNAYYTKYQNYYIKKGFGKRPIIKRGDCFVNGKKLSDHLDFYPHQKQAASALWKAISVGYDIPLKTPTNEDGSENTNTLSSTKLSTYRGIVHHYHLTRKKIDCGGFDITKYL